MDNIINSYQDSVILDATVEGYDHYHSTTRNSKITNKILKLDNAGLIHYALCANTVLAPASGQKFSIRGAGILL